MATTTTQISESFIWEVLHTVPDPEIPVLSVVDLGIIRAVLITEDGIDVTITPTYSGCPAMKTISVNILSALEDAGLNKVNLHTALSPAWTTDWLTESGKEKLRKYGIAPPVKSSHDKNQLFPAPPTVSCPRCNSNQTERINEFGSTPCKSLYQCKDCLEPFDYFKCH